MSSAPKTSLGSRLFTTAWQQLLVFAVCVGIPAFVTAIAPVSRVHLERQDERVSASAKTYLLFFVPYKTRKLDAVVSVDSRFAKGTVRRERRSGANRDRFVKSEDEGFLILVGPGDRFEVSVSPADLDATVERVQDFLDDKQAPDLQLFVVANWKFSVLIGGLASLLLVLYVVAIVGGLLLKLIHFYQAARGIPPESRLFAPYTRVVRNSTS